MWKVTHRFTSIPVAEIKYRVTINRSVKAMGFGERQRLTE